MLRQCAFRWTVDEERLSAGSARSVRVWLKESQRSPWVVREVYMAGRR